VHDGGVPRPAAADGRTGRPPLTSRAEILTAARRLIARDGWAKVTIRKFAGEIGVAPTTLYHHVRDKEDLLLQLVSDLADQIPRVPLPDDPRERIVAAATVMHDALADWPWAAEVLTADDLFGESALWMVEGMVGGAIECGCTAEQAVDLYRSLWYYTVGEVLVRAHASRRGADDERPTHRDTAFARLDAEALPHLAALGARWPELASRDTYGHGLRVFVSGLLAATLG